MKFELLKAEEAVQRIKDFDTIMVGGFLQCGHPEILTAALLEDSQAENLVIISSDTGTNDLALAKLIASGRVRQVFASYIGANHETGKLMLENPESVVLVPQGSLAEKIRAGGAGIGGILTKVGLGTVVQSGKEIIVVDGEEYLLERPMKAQVALIKADAADAYGNLYIQGSAKNFNEIMATAAEYVVAQVNEIIEWTPDQISIPAIYVDAIVEVGNE